MSVNVPGEGSSARPPPKRPQHAPSSPWRYNRDGCPYDSRFWGTCDVNVRLREEWERAGRPPRPPVI